MTGAPAAAAWEGRAGGRAMRKRSVDGDASDAGRRADEVGAEGRRVMNDGRTQPE